MTYCETCGVNVKGKRLRECVLSGHKIVWNYYKPNVPTVKLTKREEEKLEQVKKIVEEVKKILPKERLEAIDRIAEELRGEFYDKLERK
jgi:hypothetical protein